MNAAKTSKIVGRYESGLLAAAEVASSLLYDLICESELDTGFLSSVESLPDEVRREFICLLRRIQQEDYRWTPLLLTSARVPEVSAEQTNSKVAATLCCAGSA